MKIPEGHYRCLLDRAKESIIQFISKELSSFLLLFATDKWPVIALGDIWRLEL